MARKTMQITSEDRVTDFGNRDSLDSRKRRVDEQFHRMNSVTDPVSGRKLKRGRPVATAHTSPTTENRPAPKGSDVGPGAKVFAPNRSRPHVQKGLDTPTNRAAGNVGRVLDPAGGGFLRAGQPVPVRHGPGMSTRSKVTDFANRWSAAHAMGVKNAQATGVADRKARRRKLKGR